MAKKTNCVKNGVPYYRLSAVVGYNDKGQPKRKEFYGDCKADAEAKRNKYMNDLKDGLAVDAAKLTVGQLFNIWVYEILRVDKNIGISSFERYEGTYRNHIKDTSICMLLLVEIKSLHIQRFYNQLADSGDTQSSIENIHKLLNKFFNYAVSSKYLRENPCSSVSIPGEKSKAQREIEVFTDDEIVKLRIALEGNRLRFFFLLALGTGMRRGELLALQYDDIVDGVIQVKRSLSSVGVIDANGVKTRELRIGEPKTKHSIRSIPLPESLVKELQLHKSKQSAERMQAGIGKADYLFTTASGNMIDPKNFNRAYKRLLNSAGVPERKFHTFRHTYATKLISAGTPLPVVQKLMGHSDIATTMIYTHVSIKDQTEAVKVLSALFQ